ncbi:MAG: hypothetical protein Q8L53_16620 [Aestuariivirga sp.]|nr:hypothetical protein [Aestuariivirga sp.]
MSDDWKDEVMAECYGPVSDAMLDARPTPARKGTDMTNLFNEADRNEAEKAICQDECAALGEPACWKVNAQWPNPNCDRCGPLADLALAAAVASVEARGAMQIITDKSNLDDWYIQPKNPVAIIRIRIEEPKT